MFFETRHLNMYFIMVPEIIFIFNIIAIIVINSKVITNENVLVV